MIIHYLKVAFRNLFKHKTQSIISIVGLAIGFTCFSLATLWLRWEMTYDSFHKDADRIYILARKTDLGTQMRTTIFCVPLASDLKLDFPEIESTCAIVTRYTAYIAPDGSPLSTVQLHVDSCFLTMFNISLTAGSMDFLDNPDHLALTEEMAVRYFGSDSALGKDVESNNGKAKKTVTALLKGWGKHSNLPFEALSRRDRRNDENRNSASSEVWVKLKKGTDVESFQEKLYNYEMRGSHRGAHSNGLEIIPIEQCRQILYSNSLAVEFHYLIMFSVTGGMIILCALFNYLSLFSSRLHMRVREMSLRMVCGSSNRRLYTLLSMEFVLVLAFACLLGLVIIELVLPLFREFTGVEGGIYWESLFYFGALVLFAMLAFLLVIYHFSRHTLQKSMKGIVDKVGQQLFFRTSIVLQMMIGILFIFSICVIIKQINYLRNIDLGMDRKNIAVFYVNTDSERSVIAGKLKQMPLITEVLDGGYPLLPQPFVMGMGVNDWDGKQPTDEDVTLEIFIKGEAMTKFYNLRLLKGELLPDTVGNKDKVLINESGAKYFGWDNPIGKRVQDFTVIGMIKDIHNLSPTLPVKPALIIPEAVKNWQGNSGGILIKYQDHSWENVRNSLDSIAKEFPESHCRTVNAEEEYEKFIRSENTLLKLLSIAATVCILISAFGIYSFVTLTCERRRKEIAIRKVNGARIGDILLIFLKEYAILLLISSVFAFSAGYVLMKRWLESYVEQTSISIWEYLIVFASIALVVLFSIGSRVWMAARQNPAEVIKSE